MQAIIRILTGISRPTYGTVAIFGHDIEHDTITVRQSMEHEVQKAGDKFKLYTEDPSREGGGIHAID